MAKLKKNLQIIFKEKLKLEIKLSVNVMEVIWDLFLLMARDIGIIDLFYLLDLNYQIHIYLVIIKREKIDIF